MISNHYSHFFSKKRPYQLTYQPTYQPWSNPVELWLIPPSSHLISSQGAWETRDALAQLGGGAACLVLGGRSRMAVVPWNMLVGWERDSLFIGCDILQHIG